MEKEIAIRGLSPCGEPVEKSQGKLFAWLAGSAKTVKAAAATMFGKAPKLPSMEGFGGEVGRLLELGGSRKDSRTRSPKEPQNGCWDRSPLGSDSGEIPSNLFEIMDNFEEIPEEISAEIPEKLESEASKGDLEGAKSEGLEGGDPKAGDPKAGDPARLLELKRGVGRKKIPEAREALGLLETSVEIASKAAREAFLEADFESKAAIEAEEDSLGEESAADAPREIAFEAFPSVARERAREAADEAAGDADSDLGGDPPFEAIFQSVAKSVYGDRYEIGASAGAEAASETAGDDVCQAAGEAVCEAASEAETSQEISSSRGLIRFGGEERFALSPSWRRGAAANGDQIEREVASSSIIFGLLRHGREEVFRELESRSIPELDFLRASCEELEEELGRFLKAVQEDVARARLGPFGRAGFASRFLMASEVNLRAAAELFDSLELDMSIFWRHVVEKADELDKAASAAGWRAATLRPRASGGDLASVLEKLGNLGNLDFGNAAREISDFFAVALEGLRLLVLGGGGLSDLFFGKARAPLTREFLLRVKADPKEFPRRALRLRLILGRIARDLAFVADSGLPGRVRALRLFRALHRQDWRGLRGRLRALESTVLRLTGLTQRFGWDRHPYAALAIRRVVEFGPGRFGDSLMGVANSLARIWRILEPFRQGPETFSGAAHRHATIKLEDQMRKKTLISFDPKHWGRGLTVSNPEALEDQILEEPSLEDEAPEGETTEDEKGSEEELSWSEEDLEKEFGEIGDLEDEDYGFDDDEDDWEEEDEDEDDD